MRRSRVFEATESDETTDVALVASMFAASVGMIWDLATGHVMAFESKVSELPDEETRHF